MTSSTPVICAQLIETLNVGGAENLAVRVANGMADAGHESHLVVITGADGLRSFVGSNVHLHELGFFRESVTRPLRAIGSIAAGHRLINSLIHRSGIQVVQTHLPGANFWGLSLAMRGGVAVVATIHNNQEFRYGDNNDPVRARFRRSAYSAIIKRCAATVAVSEAVKSSLVRDLSLDPTAADRITVIRNGVPVEPLGQCSDRERIRADFGLSPSAFMFLAAGRHCEQKNFIDLVHAAGRLTADGREWLLVIAGEGPQTALLKRHISDLGLASQVRMPGNIRDLSKLMQASDVFVLPSLWEGLPLVLLEAMAAGLPIVGSRIPGVVEVVVDGDTGLLVEAGDQEALTNAMYHLLADPELAARFGRNARTLAEREFDFRVTAGRISELYERLASGRSS